MAKSWLRFVCNAWMVLVAGVALAHDDTCGWIWHAPGESRPVYMKHDGKWRSYRLYVPTNYRPGAPLIVDFHGQTSSRNAQMGLSCWKDLAEREGAIVAYPQALSFPTTWDAGDYCCHPRGHDDEGFALHLVQCLANVRKSGLVIDRQRVFAVGFSNGAAMAGRLACNHSDVFAGAALASQGFPYRFAESCRQDSVAGQKPPFPVVELRGKWDFIVPYSISLGWSPAASRSVERWASTNRCEGEPQEFDTCEDPASGAGCLRDRGRCTRYDNCEGGVAVTQCSVGDDHFVYGNPQRYDFCEAAWREFQQLPIRP